MIHHILGGEMRPWLSHVTNELMNGADILSGYGQKARHTLAGLPIANQL